MVCESTSFSLFCFGSWKGKKREGREGKEKEKTDECRFSMDLFEKMPYHSLSEEDRNVFWDDGLHFTAAGYAKIGRLVAERVVEIVDSEMRDEE